MEDEMNAREIATRYRIDDCTRCRNECAVACPVFRHYGSRHPQELAHRFLAEGERAFEHPLVWDCVTCGACTEACPFTVPFADFIREARIGRTDFTPAFGGLIHAYQRMQAAGPAGREKGVRPPKGAVPSAKERLAWIDGSLRVAARGETVLFTGCLALFDAVSGPSCGESFAAMAKGAVRLLNALGVSPVILEDERCCGRDLYDIGERDAFAALARRNVESIAGAGATRVLTICPECAFTLKETYREALGDVPFEVRHLTEFLAENLGRLAFTPGAEKTSFHDPCYLCRGLGVREAPRELLARLGAAKPVALERAGRSAPCCGAGSWVNHGPHTRTAVNERLAEAQRRGADTLVTACPKCTLLYAEVLPGCAWRQSPVVVKDLISLAASRLAG
jgi:heterodisulfide reductase subunit D